MFLFWLFILHFLFQEVASKICTHGELYSHPEQCSRYFVCLDGFLIEQKCNPEHHFDYEQKLCLDSPQCTLRKLQLKINCLAGSFEKHPIYCNRYIVCKFNYYIERKCLRYLHWDSKARYCGLPERAKCTVKKGTLHSFEGCRAKYVADKAHCDRYVVCINGTFQLEHCPYGLEWNNATNQCDFLEGCLGKKRGGPVAGEPFHRPQLRPRERTTTENSVDNFSPEDGKPLYSTSATTPTKPSTDTKSTTPKSTFGETSTTPKSTFGETSTTPNSTFDGYKGKMFCIHSKTYSRERTRQMKRISLLKKETCDYYILNFIDRGTTDGKLTINEHSLELLELFRPLQMTGSKILLALADGVDYYDWYKLVIASNVKRDQYLNDTLNMVMRYNLSGFHFVWTTTCKTGKCIVSKSAMTGFYSKMSSLMHENKLLATTTVMPYFKYSGMLYNRKALADILDFIMVSAPLYTQYAKYVYPISPFEPHQNANQQFKDSIKQTIEAWGAESGKKEKIIYEVPLYFTSFEVKDEKFLQFNAPLKGAGPQLEKSALQKGLIGHTDLCVKYTSKEYKFTFSAKEEFYPLAMTSTVITAYFNKESYKRAARFVRENRYGGGSVLYLDLDDFEGRCDKSVPWIQYEDGKLDLLEYISKLFIGDESR